MLCMMLLFLPATLFGAGKTPRKVVRVAYQEFNRQMVVDEHNKPVAGYAYDYIQTIGTYAGWDVRYVPCSSFFDSVRLLRAGKVDVIYEISYTKERAAEMLFPDEPMGYEYYYLYTSDKNTSITPGDYKSMQGKTVGVTGGTILADMLTKWCKKKNVELKFVEFEEIAQKEAALYAGKIDLDVELSMLAKRNLSAIEKIGASAYYLVARKDRPDLITDINTAMEKVLSNDLFYFSRLQERYFADTVLGRNLTTEERNWLAEHKTLRIGYLDDYLPFCTRDEKGRPIGAAIDAINAIIVNLKLEDKLDIEFICFDSQKKGFRAVESGEIDLMLPAYISNSVKQDYRIIGGKVLAPLASDIAYLDEHRLSRDRRIAVNRNNLMQYYYSKDSYPNSKIVFYDDIGGCLDGLLNKTADGSFLNGIRSEALLKPGKYHALRTVRAAHDFQLRIAFAEDNLGLMLLFDRGLTMLDPDFINKASYSYVWRIYSFSVIDFLRDHIVPVIISVAFLVALVVALVGYQIGNRRLAEINRALKIYSATIEKQREREVELRQQLEVKQGELEDALEMAQSASRAKTIFLSNMSHDIRTPMNSIVGFTGLALGHLEDKERVRDYLTTIARSSEHLLNLINDVLDLSRIESGKMVLNEKPESLSDILHALRDIVNADVRAKQHDFSIDADVRDEFVCCDRMRLNQVLLNLVSNAIKYTHSGGTISLRIAERPATRAGYGVFEFRCKDDGIGMSKEFTEKIFAPFTREENTTISGIQGTGLGMAITKNIVDMMGGSISVTSQKDEGSEFIVTVELRIAERKDRDPAIPGLKGLRVLVVDDDEKVCRKLAEMLRNMGMRGEWCVTGDAAVDRAAEAARQGDRFKVCIVDWLMPDMDGAEMVRRIREVSGEDAPVIIPTAYDWTDLEREAKDVGVGVLVSKPIFPSDLRKALLQVCGKAVHEQTAGEERGFSFKGKRVLMVDDSKLNLRVGVLLLQEQGMTVETASNGKIAVDMIRQNGVDAYDFVLMDIQMPEMGGYEATSLIRKLPGGDKLRIIAFSANAFEEDREKSLKAGMDGHIAKPLKIAELLKELNRFVA